MAKIYASKSAKAFFREGRLPLPADAVEISVEYWQGLLDAQGFEQTINFDTPDGIPVLVPTQTSIEAATSRERAWRNAELSRADIELNKVQDGMGVGTVTAWRDYRCALRRWPESHDFPDSTKRPVAPDAIV